MPANRIRPLWAAIIVLVLLGAHALLYWTDTLAMITDRTALEGYVVQLGLLGPLTIIALLAVAIVLNPIPSAPIALAAGAVYGHVWGTVYVVIGAETGSIVAFSIARIVGYEVLRKWFGEQLSLGPLASQNTLMAIVFFSRLMPFISFDLVSYAAGLTPLGLWRFALATLAGIIPASFLLAHFGGELVSADASRTMVTVLLLGMITLIPIAARLIWNWYKRSSD